MSLTRWIRSKPGLRRLARSARMAAFRRLYRLRNVDPTFYLGGRADIASDFRAGAFSYVGRDCCVCPRVSIGAYTMLAHEVSIQGGDHRIDVAGTPMYFAGRPEMPETRIGEDVWIGHRAIILAGATIGRGAIVGAGAVVTSDVPPYAIFGGVPARQIGERFPDPADRAKHDAMLDAPPREGALAPQRVEGVSGN